MDAEQIPAHYRGDAIAALWKLGSDRFLSGELQSSQAPAHDSAAVAGDDGIDDCCDGEPLHPRRCGWGMRRHGRIPVQPRYAVSAAGAEVFV